MAGSGDVVETIREAEMKGAQAYITGEIHCHIDNDYGRQKIQRVMDVVQQTKMSLIGVSHSTSEYLVMKTSMREWIAKQSMSRLFFFHRKNGGYKMVEFIRAAR